MNSSDTRISTYLDDLARMLADLDPATRDDVLAGVREHLDATLAEHPDDPAAVDAALLRLGPPEQVAAAARADLPTGSPRVHPDPPPARRHPRRARVAAVISLALLALPLVVGVVARAAGEIMPAPSLDEPTGMFIPHPSEALTLLPVLLLPWVVSVVVAMTGPDLSGGTRTWLVLLGPAMSFTVLVAALLGEPRSMGTPVSLAAFGVVLTGIVLTGRRAWRETRT